MGDEIDEETANSLLWSLVGEEGNRGVDETGLGEMATVLCERCTPRELHLAFSGVLASASASVETKLLLLQHLPKALARIAPPKRREKFVLPSVETARALLESTKASAQPKRSEGASGTSTEGTSFEVAVMDDIDMDRGHPIVPVVVASTAACFALDLATLPDILPSESRAVCHLATLAASEIGQMDNRDVLEPIFATVDQTFVKLGIGVEVLISNALLASSHGPVLQLSSGDLDAIPTEPTECFPLSVLGIGILVHHAFKQLPSVLSPVWLLSSIAPAISAMLSHPSTTMSRKGWELISWIIPMVPQRSIRDDVLPESLFGLLTAMLWSMVHTSDHRQRTANFASFGRLFGLLGAACRFDALKRLLSSAPVPVVAGLMVRRLKSEIDAAWPGVAVDDEDTRFFCSRKVIELLPIFMHSGNLVERNEVILEALNLYRYLLIRDRETNMTGLWTTSQVCEVDNRFLSPLRNEVRKLKADYVSVRTENDCRERIAAMERLGLPQLSVEEFMRSNCQAITNLTLIDDLIDRIHELVATLPDKTE